MNKRLLTLCVWVGGLSPLFAVPPDITMQFVGTESPSSFPKQMYIHIVNPAYTPMDLAKKVASSQLVIDGKSSWWAGKTFQGPAGIPPVGEWDGCLSAENYAPPITPGTHQVSLKLGDGESAVSKTKVHQPVNWRKGNMKSRLKEVQQLAAVLIDGLPRSCVENWLNVKDGGFVEDDRARYFLEPDIKMVVPYRQTFVSGRERTVVDGTPIVYQEARLSD